MINSNTKPISAFVVCQNGTFQPTDDSLLSFTVVVWVVMECSQLRRRLMTNADKFRYQIWSVWNFLGSIIRRCLGKEPVLFPRGHMETRLKKAAEIEPKNFSASLDGFANEHMIDNDWHTNANLYILLNLHWENRSPFLLRMVLQTNACLFRKKYSLQHDRQELVWTE